MTVSSNYSNYASYSSSSISSAQRQKPNFEEMANEIMSSMDSDGNGSINLDEFTSAIESSSSSSSSSSLSDIFSSIDTDGNKAMSSEEFMAALEASKPQHKPDEMGSMPQPPPPPSNENSSSTKESYSALDTNKDGTISLEELLGTLNDKLQEESQNTTSSSNDAFEKIKTGMLERMLSYYSSTSSTTSSSLSLSA